MIDGTNGGFSDEYGGNFDEDQHNGDEPVDGAYEETSGHDYLHNDSSLEGDGSAALEFINDQLSPADDVEKVLDAVAVQEATRAAFREMWVTDYVDTYRLIPETSEDIVEAYDRSSSDIKGKLDHHEVYLRDPDQTFGYTIGASLTAHIVDSLPPEAQTPDLTMATSNLRAAVAHIISGAGGINHPLYAEYEQEGLLDGIFESITHQAVLERITDEFLEQNSSFPADNTGKIAAVEGAVTVVKELLGVYDVDLTRSTQSYSLLASVAIHTKIAEELSHRGLSPSRIAIGTRTASAHLLAKNSPAG